ncbi:hypothetical protein [Rhizobium leguminosarum]|uniref:hypothetical protein n=1 Tax=Rhizobium leguminosarum TaxID=384 RepID=UPI001C966F37|nr:hypothetical protein [Rhizobium leguminosarum]MBY5585311.1 hypothetical protein [Rhizobium leguminosarum]
MADDVISAPLGVKQVRIMICTICGDECERTGQLQKYCVECRAQNKRQQSRKNAGKYNAANGKNVTGAVLLCSICGEIFKARQGGNKYCSKECRRAHELARHHEKTSATGLKKAGTSIACEDCGETIVFLGGPHKRCEECKKRSKVGKTSRWRADNPDKVAEMQRLIDARRKDDPKRIELSRVYSRRMGAKRTADPGKNLHHRMSQLIRVGLKSGKAGRSWLSMVPYDVEQLEKHLERQFLPGMTWANMGEWHIDHRKPRSSFKFSSPTDDDFVACWAITNLQPLWASDNIKKSNKLTLLL